MFIDTPNLKIETLKGTIKLETGLHIGKGNGSRSIGGVDDSVIKDRDGNPYIPFSSLKGKMRSMLQHYYGLVPENGGPLNYNDYIFFKQNKAALTLIQLFGVGASNNIPTADQQKIGSTRLRGGDTPLNSEWLRETKQKDLPLIELKSETAIDRVTGTAKGGSLRTFERVVSGAKFDFNFSLQLFKDDDNDALLTMLLTGFKLLEMDAIGKGGSRGSGKIAILFKDEKLQSRMDSLDLWAGQ